MKLTENLVYKYIKNSNQNISFYSESTQKEIVKKVFQEAILQKIDSEQKLQALIDKVILQKPGITKVSLPTNPGQATLVSMLLADPNWYKKNLTWEETASLLASLFWEKDPQIFESARKWIQDKLKAAHEEIPCDEMRAIYIHNLLSYYPFFSPEKGETLEIPIGANGKLVSYLVEPIELTPFFLGSPLIAYGLTSKEGPPLLLFKGTTFPSDDGYYQSLLTDANPFAAVGSYAFQLAAKRRIENFLKKETQNGLKAEIMGASLGGALSLQTVCYFPEHIHSVYAFNSPAMTSLEIKKWEEKTRDLPLKSIPKVNVFLQNSDPISTYVGSHFASNWDIHRVFAPIAHPFQAHAATYTAHKEAFIIPASPTAMNLSFPRRIWPFFQNVLSIPVFLGGLIVILLASIIQAIIRIAKHAFVQIGKVFST